MEVASGFSPTLVDAVKIGALLPAYEDGKCVVTALTYFPLVNIQAGFMHPSGYTYEHSCHRWSKMMSPADFQKLESLAPKTADPTQSIKAVERHIARLQALDLVGVPRPGHTPSLLTLLGSEEAVERWQYFNEKGGFAYGMYGDVLHAPAAYPFPP